MRRDWKSILAQMCLFDDEMMQKCFDDNATVQYVVRIILQRAITVKSVSVQYVTEPSSWHGAKFDVLATDENGRLCDIEIQQRCDGALVKRASFYSALLGKRALHKGEDYDKMRETFVIFIMGQDVFERGQAVYRIERRFEDTLLPFGDGQHIVFVNGDWQGDDDIGHLVHDMKETNPDNMYSDVLRERMRIFKEADEEEGMVTITQKLMNEALEEGRTQGLSQGLSQGRIQTARAMLTRHLDAALIADCTGLTMDAVLHLNDDGGERG